MWQSEYETGLDVVPKTDNGDEWETYVRSNAKTFHHPVGTCAMLLPKLDGGVVDSNLPVYGTSNLTVVNASVIPILVSAHPQSMGLQRERQRSLVSGGSKRFPSMACHLPAIQQPRRSEASPHIAM
jgi:hypothetical protein